MSEWYKDWFSSEEYYKVYKHRDNTDAEKLNKLISETIKIKPGSSILDAACGFGRHSILWGGEGFKTVGFDLSFPFIQRAISESRKHNISVDYFVSDIRFPAVCKKFDLIINLFTSFGYFNTDDENFAFFVKCKKLLNEGGYLVFDYFNSEFLIRHLKAKTIKSEEELTIIETRKIEHNRVIKEIQIIKNQEIVKYYESVAIYSCDFILEKFTSLGYKIYKVFGDYEGANFDSQKSKRLVVIVTS